MITVQFITPTETLISSIQSSKVFKFKTKRGKVYTGKEIYHIQCNLVNGRTLLDKAIEIKYVTPYTEDMLIKAARGSNRQLMINRLPFSQ